MWHDIEQLLISAEWRPTVRRATDGAEGEITLDVNNLAKHRKRLKQLSRSGLEQQLMTHARSAALRGGKGQETLGGHNVGDERFLDVNVTSGFNGFRRESLVGHWCGADVNHIWRKDSHQ
jgi:uncharacterized protein (DUF58 family)